jgi:hypothetical protein
MNGSSMVHRGLLTTNAAEAEFREVREKRFTSLDRVILRSAGPFAAEQYGQIMIPLVSRLPREGPNLRGIGAST